MIGLIAIILVFKKYIFFFISRGICPQWLEGGKYQTLRP